MLPDVENLIALQQADREIHRLKEEIAALPRRVAAIEEKLAGTKAALENAKAAIKADETARRKYETNIQDLQGKISKYRDQSLAVKTNDQYKALLHEIQFAEQDIRGNEDKILELMLDSDSREKDLKAAEAELKAETAEIEKEKNIAREQTAKDEKEMAEWNAKRDKARAGVKPDTLEHYDRVAKHRGSGLAEVLNQKCTGCSVMLRPQTFNDVRNGERTMVCDSCQRILYYNPANDTQPVVQSVTKKRRAHPKFDATQAWYYRPEYGGSGEVYLSFTNANSSSTRRVYDIHTGRRVGDVLTREGEYRLGFPEDLSDSVRLNGTWSEEEIDSWGDEMPMVVLDILQRDLDLARAEAATRSHAEAVAVQHPAAS
ncbi:MAG TPA: C4-type zinc ribbon domain-containing protein [Terriglobales bacterium]